MPAMDAPLVFTKVVALALASYCCNVCHTPPTPPAPAAERDTDYKNRDPFGSLIRMLAGMYKLMFHIFIAIEVCSLILSTLPPHIIPLQPASLLVLPAPAPSIFTPQRILGLFATLSGTHLRVTCFRLLNNSYTFELSLQKNHKLVTHGPYAWVRHPAYTGGLTAMAGALFVVLGPGSWWAERARDRWLMYAYGLFFVAFSVAFALGVAKRCVVEDAVLKAHFRDEWVGWSQDTPYRLVPLLW